MRAKRILIAIGGYIAANLAIPLVGLALGLAFALVTAAQIIATGLGSGDLTPGRLSLSMLPLYYGFLGLYWTIPAVPGIVVALPFVIAGELKKIRAAAYYVLVGGASAALGYTGAELLQGGAQVQFPGPLLIPAGLFGLIAGAIYWRFVGRNAGGQTAASA